MHPPFLFCLAKRETGRARSKEKSAWRAPVQWPSARRGSAHRCLRRFGLAFGHAILFCDSCNCCPVADGAEGVGVVIALRCFSFRCRWPVVDEGFSNGLLLHRLLRPPGQRVAKRNARKEELVKCVLANRRPPHPHRGNPPSSLYRIPPRPSGSHRESAGIISRRPPYSAEARRRRSAIKSGLFFWTVHGLFSFRQDRKENGGALPSHQHGCFLHPNGWNDPGRPNACGTFQERRCRS